MARDVQTIADNMSDDYRTARLNVLYYGERLANLQSWNTAMEIAIAVGTSGAIASLTLFKTEFGIIILGIFASVSAILGVLKPILGLAKKIERVTRVWSGWNGQYYALKTLVEETKVNSEVTPEIEKGYKAVRERRASLSSDDDPNPDRNAIGRWRAIVNREIPLDSLPTIAA